MEVLKVQAFCSFKTMKKQDNHLKEQQKDKVDSQNT